MKKAIITGVTGQDGGYLAKLLLDKGYKVYGAQRRNTGKRYWRLDELGITDKIEFVDIDLGEPYNIEKVIEKVQPDEFYNLAAMSFVGSSWSEPVHTSLVNGIGVLNCLEAIKTIKRDVRMYQASTSEMYGLQQNGDGFRDENTPLIPRSPYGVAKLFGHQMTRNYRESYDMFCCSGILFNHESPLRGLEFVTRKITDGVAKIVTGKEDFITLGNLDAYRDWGFAGDYVEAMWLMLQQDDPEDFVIATGKTHSLEDFVRLAFEEHGLDWNNHVIQSDKYFRPSDLSISNADPSYAFEKLGWKAKVDMPTIVARMTADDVNS